jgi:hypothetical protein
LHAILSLGIDVRNYHDYTWSKRVVHNGCEHILQCLQKLTYV